MGFHFKIFTGNSHHIGECGVEKYGGAQSDGYVERQKRHKYKL